MLNPIRYGKFTSSSIYRLIPNLNKDGSISKVSEKAIANYIFETKVEGRVQRSLNRAGSARPLIWGKFVESYVAAQFDLEYEYCADKTICHQNLPWCGTPDLVKSDTVADIKCPFTLLSFALLYEVSQSKDKGKALRLANPEWYWQLVSNSILAGKKYAELIAFCPKKSELETLRELANDWDDTDDLTQNDLSWIFFAKDTDLPYVPDGGFYPNTVRIKWEVDNDSVQLLQNQIINNQGKIEL